MDLSAYDGYNKMDLRAEFIESVKLVIAHFKDTSEMDPAISEILLSVCESKQGVDPALPSSVYKKFIKMENPRGVIKPIQLAKINQVVDILSLGP
jgi:hypothetical protein